MSRPLELRRRESLHFSIRCFSARAFIPGYQRVMPHKKTRTILAC
jgi:hypothetical protein